MFMDRKPGETLKIRFAYMDNIRSLVIFFVVAMHAAVTYSGFGGWYYIEGSSGNLSIPEMVFFGFFQSFIQAWTMGILFFMSAYLTTKALAKRGTLNYLKERLFRLGVPLLIYMFLIHPFIIFILLGIYSDRSLFDNYISYIVGFFWLDATGPLWFVQVLLLFCIIYAIIKKLFPGSIKINKITTINIVVIIAIITMVAFLVRLALPIGSSFLNLQFPYFPSYVVMFICGILVGENNLLDKITDVKNIKWLKLTFIIGIPLWAGTMLLGGALEGKEYFNGGFHWQNFTFALWESFTAISFSIGLFAFFKKKVNIDNKFTRLMRENAFGIYCFHAPILVAISLILKNIILIPILKFALILILASVSCLLFSFLIRKIRPIGILYK